jgi:exodeoxyribonuclease VII large subunit
MRLAAPHVEIRFFQTRVQGKGAEIEIAEAMDRASRAHVDVIVLTRGGGSSDDRVTFNREAVVRAIVRSDHPVITALGHLKDVHLADEVADLSVATPTAAAVQLSQEWGRAFERLHTLQSALMRGYRSVLADRTQRMRFSELSLQQAAKTFLSRCAQNARNLERRLDQLSPAARVAAWQIGLVRANGNLTAWSRHGVDRYSRRLALAQAALDGEDPTRPLARGYAIVTKNGAAVRDAATLDEGDVVSARLNRGTFDARVESVQTE